MAKYLVNEAGVAHARELIAGRRYLLRSEWGRGQPGAEEENAYLERHFWAEYGAWHLAPCTATSAGPTPGVSADRYRRGITAVQQGSRWKSGAVPPL
jgi:hypothetical protein